MKVPAISYFSIKYKLFFLFLALILVPFVVYTGVVLHQTAREAEDFGTHTADQVLMQTDFFIESRIDALKRTLDFAAERTELQAVFTRDAEPYRENLGDWCMDATRLRTARLAMYQDDPDIASIAMYMTRGIAAFTETGEFMRLDSAHGEDWYRTTIGERIALTWLPPGSFTKRGIAQDLSDPLFYCMRRIPDEQDLRTTIGAIRADIPRRILEDILDKAEFTPAAFAFIVNSKGSVIALSGRAAKPNPSPNEISSLCPPTPGWKKMTAGKVDYLAGQVPIRNTDWRLALLVPYRDITAFGDRTRRQMSLVLLCMLPLLLPLALLVANTSTSRLRRLTSGVRRISKGKFDIHLEAKGRDEIGELTVNFNSMVSRIQDLMSERYQFGQEIKNLEMKALQAQINPHFLYNTLDLVNCLSLRYGAPRITEAVTALSRFYRLSLSGGAETVTIAQELEHVETYLLIQNIRFENCIELRVEADEAALPCSIPKITLQPLVENAIVHGILEKPEGRGRITIRVGRSENPPTIEIVVEDDGVGIDAQVLANLLRKPNAPIGTKAGYGARNIDTRIKLTFGENYGLTYRSERGRGTTAVLRFPARG